MGDDSVNGDVKLDSDGSEEGDESSMVMSSLTHMKVGRVTSPMVTLNVALHRAIVKRKAQGSNIWNYCSVCDVHSCSKRYTWTVTETGETKAALQCSPIGEKSTN